MISQNEIKRTIGAWSILKFFPSGAEAGAAISELLLSLVDSDERLEWLRGAVLGLNEWPGPGEIRGIYCTRFKPADGIEAYSALSGFSPADCEAANIAKALPPRDTKLLESGQREQPGVSADPEMNHAVQQIATEKRMSPPTPRDVRHVEDVWERSGLWRKGEPKL
jgi:hypothetical protein